MNGSLRVKLELLKAPFLVLHFSCYTFMVFLTMLSVILLSMLKIILFILSVTRHLICRNKLNWSLSLNLIYETLDLGKKWLVDCNTEKTQLVSFDRSNNNGSIDIKMNGFTVHPCTEYCCNVWASAPSCCLELLDKLQNRICKTVGPLLAASLEPLASENWPA